MKLFYVTESQFLRKKTDPVNLKVRGFVTVFGWESAMAKAAQKYPGIGSFSLIEMPKYLKPRR